MKKSSFINFFGKIKGGLLLLENPYFVTMVRMSVYIILFVFV